MAMFDPAAQGMQPRGLQVLRLFGIPVYIEPMFLALIAIIFFFYQDVMTPVSIGLFCFVILFSLLAHEFGHAIVSRLVGCDGIRIALTGFGGYATHTPTTRGKSLLITLAGPFFGYVLGFTALALDLKGGPLLEIGPEGAMLDLLRWTWWINLFWSTFNLLPIHPMDGGQSLFHALTYWLRPERAMLWVARLSMALCIPLGFLAYQSGYIFIAFFSLMFFMDNMKVSQALG
jgi:Zn-dependent protease